MYCKQVPKGDNLVCPQTFIVRILIIKNTCRRYIYIQQKEGAREQDSGETERERVCESVRIGTNCGGVHHKNGRWKNGPFWDKLDGFTSTYEKVFLGGRLLIRI